MRSSKPLPTPVPAGSSSRSLVFLGVCLASACGTPTPVTPTETTSPTVAPDPSPTEPVPAPSSPQSLSRYVPSDDFRDIGDDRTGAVLSNRRIVIKRAEATVIDPKPIDDLGSPHRIPEVFGGGYVFVGKRTVRFTRAFDGALDTIASVTPKKDEPLEIGFGHGSILVKAAPNPAELHALPGGKKLSLPVPGTTQMFASPKGGVALVANKGELYFSPAKGASFKKLASSGVEQLAYDGKGIVVHFANKVERIDAKGRLVPRPDEPGMVVADNLAAFVDPWPDFSGPPPQRSDAERLLDPLVVLVDDDIAIAANEQDLVVLDAHTGKQKEKKQAFPGQTNCFPIRGGTPAFVGCNGQTEMSLFRIDAIDRPVVLEKKFKGVYTQDFGEPSADAPLVLAKRCDGSNSPGTFCVRQKDATWKELPKPADPAKILGKLPFLIHVAAASDGSAYAFGWLDGNGDLVVIDSKQKKVRRIATSSIPKWAAGGIRWQALAIVDGKLRFFIQAKGAPTSGILELSPDDRIDAKQLKGRLAPIGKRALFITDHGTLEETLDAGATFHEVPLPPGGAPDGGMFHCVETGCSVGPWRRVGWGP